MRDPFAAPESEPATHTVTLVHRRAAPEDYEPAVSEPPPRDLFVSGYGGIVTRFSAVSRKFGMLSGAHGGLLLGDRLSVGGAYYRLKRRYGAPILDSQDRPLAIAMAYGGVEVGATVIRRGRFEAGLQTLIGAGVACLTYDTSSRSRKANCVDTVRMMVFEPAAVARVDITKWMRLGIEGGYRGVARSKWRPPTDFDLGGGYMGLSLDLGWFDRSE